eukprot:Awhi_evm1s11081
MSLSPLLSSVDVSQHQQGKSYQLPSGLNIKANAVPVIIDDIRIEVTYDKQANLDKVLDE